MRTDIHAAVERAAVREIVGISVGIKGKLEHLHPRQAGICKELLYLRCNIAEILRNKGQVVEPACQHADEIHSRAFSPFAVSGRCFSGRHGPVAFKAAEMINAKHIVQAGCALNTADPPAETVRLHTVIVVKRIAPELSVIIKSIGRTTGNVLRAKVFIQQEEPGFTPDICRVHRYIDRDIADESDPLLFCIGTQRIPLPEEQKLGKDPEIDLLPELLRISCNCFRFTQTDGIVRPLLPADHAESGLDAHEKRIISHPGSVFTAKG